MKDTIGRNNRRLENRVCPKCGIEFRPLRSSSVFCSVPCARSKNGGHNKKAQSWWVNSKGYIEGRIWVTPSVQIRVKQHRWIMEGILGRPLEKWEDVHHKDGNKTNNSPSNLQLMSHGQHSKITNSMRDYKRGYSMNLTDEEREERSLRALRLGLSSIGRTAISKARGEKGGAL